MTDQLSKRARKVLQETLVSGERVLAVVVGRESKFLVLTDRRLLLISGALILRGSDTLQLVDLASITSGMLAVAMRMRSGDEYEFNFWPTGTNRTAANDLVRRARELQNAPTPSASPAESSAEQLAKFAQLHQQGLLSEAEFHAQKVRLLG